jgi:pullulanase/glycogen debranching enzyme
MATQHDVRIQQAYWLGPHTGCVLLSHNWKWRKIPHLVLDSERLKTTNLRLAPVDFIGRFQGVYEREDGKIVFCQEADRHPQIDPVSTPVRVAGPFNDWGRAAEEGWTLSSRITEDGTEMWECTVDRSRLHCGHHGVVFKFVTSDWQWLHVLDFAPNRVADEAGNANYQFLPRCSGRHVFQFDVTGGRALVGTHWVRLETADPEDRMPLRPGLSFYDLSTNLSLGPQVEKNKSRVPLLGLSKQATVFRVFAPRATTVQVEVFEDLEASVVQTHPLKLLDDQLTWETRVAGDLHGWYYYLRVDGENDGLTTRFDPEIRILDPWALATVGHDGPGIVIDRDQLPTIEENDRFTPPYWHDLVVVESQVRDLIARAPIDLKPEERLGFRGLTRWIASDSCYLHHLGANALELLPIHQFDSSRREDYHWGYMTTNYFSPCAHYAEAPERASQIEEFRALVDECHRRGLAVIIDVVYNHVGVPPFLLYLDKQYFFHVEPDGSMTNWSGCGNTVRAESAMVKRLIIESLVHLMQTYGVDGFRFDLAELLTVETLGEIEAALKAVKQTVILITEPWSFRGNIIGRLHSLGMSYWNDGYREFIADYVSGRGNAEGLRFYMKGSLDHISSFPAQSVNYLSSHDDRCWIDRITENEDHDGSHPTPIDVHRTHLMCAILMGSIGIPMLAAGTDFLQSKTGISNSYQNGAVNALDYERIANFEATHEYFRQWIRFRLSPWGELLRLWHTPSDGYLRLFAVDGQSSAALLFNADQSQGPRQILFAINPHSEAVMFKVDGLPIDRWREIADRDLLDLDGMASDRFSGRDQRIEMGPVDCGVWLRGG